MNDAYGETKLSRPTALPQRKKQVQQRHQFHEREEDCHHQDESGYNRHAFTVERYDRPKERRFMMDSFDGERDEGKGVRDQKHHETSEGQRQQRIEAERWRSKQLRAASRTERGTFGVQGYPTIQGITFSTGDQLLRY